MIYNGNIFLDYLLDFRRGLWIVDCHCLVAFKPSRMRLENFWKINHRTLENQNDSWVADNDHFSPRNQYHRRDLGMVNHNFQKITYVTTLIPPRRHRRNQRIYRRQGPTPRAINESRNVHVLSLDRICHWFRVASTPSRDLLDPRMERDHLSCDSHFRSHLGVNKLSRRIFPQPQSATLRLWVFPDNYIGRSPYVSYIFRMFNLISIVSTSH